MSRLLLTRRSLLVGSAAGAALWLGPFRVRQPANPASTLVADSFPALGTRVRVVIRTEERGQAQWAIRKAMAAVFDVHRTMTLHDESPLTVLNRRGSLEVPLSIATVLDAAMGVHRASGGVFDPTVSATVSGMGNVELDRANRLVRLHHPGSSLDFNGIAKGFAVDCAVDALRAAGFTDFLVNAGGDLYAAGSSEPDGDGWDVRLDVPGVTHGWQVSDRAVATSGTIHQPHHLRNPAGDRSGRQSASVLAPSCMAADAWATALCVGDDPGAPGWGPGVEGEWVDANGAVVRPA